MKKYSKIFLFVLIIGFLFAGCKSAEVSTGDVVVPSSPASTTPAAAPVAVSESPAEAPAPVLVESATYPGVYELNFADYSVEFSKTGSNQLTISYPSVVDSQDLMDLGQVLYNAYPLYLEGSELIIDSENRLAVLSLAYDFTLEEMAEFGPVIAQPLQEYLAKIVIDKAPSITVSGYGLELVVKKTASNQLYVTLPEFVTVDEIYSAAQALYDTYPDYLYGADLVVDGNNAVVTFAYDFTFEEMFAFAPQVVGAMEDYLNTAYPQIVAQYAAAQTVETTPAVTSETASGSGVTVTKTEPVEASTPAVTITASTAPAATTPASAAPASSSAPAAAPAATSASAPAAATVTAETSGKGNTGTVILIIVLIAVLVVCACFLFARKKKTDK